MLPNRCHVVCISDIPALFEGEVTTEILHTAAIDGIIITLLDVGWNNIGCYFNTHKKKRDDAKKLQYIFCVGARMK